MPPTQTGPRLPQGLSRSCAPHLPSHWCMARRVLHLGPHISTLATTSWLQNSARRRLCSSYFYNPSPAAPLPASVKFFIDSIYIIGASTLCFCPVMVIRPVLVRLPATREKDSGQRRSSNDFGRTALERTALVKTNPTSFFICQDLPSPISQPERPYGPG